MALAGYQTQASTHLALLLGSFTSDKPSRHPHRRRLRQNTLLMPPDKELALVPP